MAGKREKEGLVGEWESWQGKRALVRETVSKRVRVIRVEREFVRKRERERERECVGERESGSWWEKELAGLREILSCQVRGEWKRERADERERVRSGERERERVGERVCRVEREK